MPHKLGAPVPLYAREGREHQKYGDEGERLVAGCIPVRFKPGVAGPGGVEVLLITSRGGKGHVFPKGGWEVDEDLQSAAMRETVEEAGVRGVLEEPMLGTFPFHSNKAERLHMADGGRCVAHMFVLHTLEELASWPEAGQRQRVWCSLQEAIRVVRHEWMRTALLQWIRRCGWEHALCLPQQSSGGEAAAVAAPTAVPTAVPQPLAASPVEPAPLPAPDRVAVQS